MGNVQASNSQQISNAFNNVVNSVINNAVSNAKLNCSTTQTVNILNRGTINGGLDFNGTYTSTCMLTDTNIQMISATVKSDLQTTIQSFIDNNMQNYQGWLSFAFSLQIANNLNSSTVSNMIVNAISSNAKNTCFAQAFNSNNLQLINDGIINGGVTINSNLAVTATEVCIQKQINSYFVSNSIISQIVQQTDNHFASTQSGLSDVILYIVVGFIIVAIIYAVIAYFTPPQSQTIIRRRANVASVPVASTPVASASKTMSVAGAPKTTSSANVVGAPKTPLSTR